MDSELEEVKIEKKDVRKDSYFDGKFFEYIGYKLLATLITIVTLTIAKPWADKLILDYKINHTLYNGKRLKFEGKGSALFVQRFKWILLTIITLGVYSLWIPINMEKWVVSNIHFEDEDLVEGESFFDGKLLGLIGVNIFSYLLTIISLGILFPFALCYKQKWMASHTVINRKKIVFDGKSLSIVGHYILWWLLSCITLGIYGLWLPMKMYGWQVSHTHIKTKNEEEEKSNFIPVILATILAILLVAVLISFIAKSNIPKIISGEKEFNISDIIPKRKYEDVLIHGGYISDANECMDGYTYNESYNYCESTYEEMSIFKCNKLGGKYKSNEKTCLVIMTKAVTKQNDTYCINNWSKSDECKQCYTNIKVDSINECKKKKGYYYYGKNDVLWCTTSATNKALIKNNNTENTGKSNTETPIKNVTPSNNDGTAKTENTAPSENVVPSYNEDTTYYENTAPQETVSRCNDGYYYIYDMCYSKTDYVEGITICTGEGEMAACGVGCPVEGYQMVWDIDNGFDGNCYRYANPNY